MPREPRPWLLGSGATALDRPWKGRAAALFAEGAIGGRPDVPARMRSGAGFLCLRTDAPIVPIAICGAEELYRGKRISVRILEPVTVAELLDERWEQMPEPGSRDELRAARGPTRAISERIAEAVRDDYGPTLDPPTAPRRWRWLTRLMR